VAGLADEERPEVLQLCEKLWRPDSGAKRSRPVRLVGCRASREMRFRCRNASYSKQGRRGRALLTLKSTGMPRIDRLEVGNRLARSVLHSGNVHSRLQLREAVPFGAKMGGEVDKAPLAFGANGSHNLLLGQCECV
jgi:hypothetical protein